MANTLAVTGGTGFLGQHLLETATNAGFQIRALTRRPQQNTGQITWIEGNLANEAALKELVEGATAVIHLAGITNADSKEVYEEANVAGTRAIRQAAGSLPFVHVSSLAAREPQLSLYGASKHRSEQEAHLGSGPLAILRPPAIYGPGDKEFLALFQAVKFRVVPLPSGAKASMIYAPDLAEALIAIAMDLAGERRANGGLFEIDDGKRGYTQAQIAKEVAKAMGISIVTLPVPAGLIRTAALYATGFGRVRGQIPRLSVDRARYLVHRDWTANCQPLLSLGIWHPKTELEQGLQETIGWYQAKGWL